MSNAEAKLTTTPTPNQQATKLVDQAIKDIAGRDLVSTSEMTDLLLDIRLYLMQESATPVYES
jgi:hypothetical protein